MNKIDWSPWGNPMRGNRDKRGRFFLLLLGQSLINHTILVSFLDFVPSLPSVSTLYNPIGMQVDSPIPQAEPGTTP